MMVEKKLSGVYNTLAIDVAYDHFESFVDTLIDHMADMGIEKTRLEVCENPLVQQAFDKTIKSITEYIEFDEAYRYISDETVELCYSEELIEQRRIEQQRREEEAKQFAETLRLQREQEALNEMTITIDKKHRNKAVAILQAAGLLKKEA